MMSTLSAPPVKRNGLHRSIRTLLEKEICCRYRAGDKLPPELELARRFGVNRHTVRRATDELAREGVLAKRRGSGTVVLDPAILYPLHKNVRFTATLEDHDLDASVELLEKQQERANQQVADGLGIAIGDPVLKVLVLRRVEAAPFCLDSTWVSIERFPLFAEAYQGGSVYAFFSNRYRFQPIRRRSLISATAADDSQAELLRVAPGHPLLRVAAVDVNPMDKQPVEYHHAHFRGDRIQMEVRS